MIEIRYVALPPGLPALACRDEHGHLLIVADSGMPVAARKAAICRAKQAVLAGGHPGADVVHLRARHADQQHWGRPVAVIAGLLAAAVAAIVTFTAMPAGQASQPPVARVHVHRRRPVPSPELQVRRMPPELSARLAA